MAGKRMAAALQTLERDKTYSIADAVALVKSNSKAKFDETIDLAVNLGVDPK